MTKLSRNTRETQIELSLSKTAGESSVTTDSQFLTHMVETFARYAGLTIELKATGDLKHHLIEDVAITLGLALEKEVPATATRYGSAVIPMDDALVMAAVDLGGRPYYAGKLPSHLYEHFLQSFAINLGATLHIKVVRGRDRHHIVEAAVKATGMAVRAALAEGESVFSTKGSVELVW